MLSGALSLVLNVLSGLRFFLLDDQEIHAWYIDLSEQNKHSTNSRIASQNNGSVIIGYHAAVSVLKFYKRH
jgi:hypothetical protein